MTTTEEEIIQLEPTGKLKEKNVVTKFYYHIPSRLVRIELNHKYKETAVVFKINLDWSKNRDQIYKRLKPLGVELEDIELLAANLDNHATKIIDVIFDYKKKSSSGNSSTYDVYDVYDAYEGKGIDENNENENNFELLSVIQAKRSDEGKKRVKGRIVGRSTTIRVVSESSFQCNNHECNFSGHLEFNPPLKDVPKMLSRGPMFNPKCFKCGTFASLDVKNKYKNAKRIQLDDVDTVEEKFDRLDVIMYDDASYKIIDGEIVIIEGDLYTQKHNSQHEAGDLSNILHSDKPIKYEDRKEIKITELDKQNFYKWKKICDEKYKKDIERLEKCERCRYYNYIQPKTFEQTVVSMFAPNVIGHNDKKLGILRSLLGGNKQVDNGMDNGRRGRVHTGLVGDPGTAKTVLSQESNKLDTGSRMVDCSGASGKSLVGIVDKENDAMMVKYGVVVSAKNSHVVLNEAQSLSHEDQAHLTGIAEEGRTTLDKWGMHLDIDSPTTLILTANPVGTEWETSQMSQDKMVVIRKNLLDRIDQIYGFFDDPTENECQTLVNEFTKISKRKPHNYNFLIKYIQYAKTLEPKFIGHSPEFRLNRYWIDARLKGIIKNRGFFSFKRIAQAHAKLNLTDKIDDMIVSKTIQSLKLMFQQYGEIIDQVQDLKDVTVEEFYNILKENKGLEHSVKELCRKASERNKHINGYLDKRWDLSHNWELRDIVDMLQQRQHIKIVRLKPRILAYDAYDVYEDHSIEKNTEKNKNNKKTDESSPSYTSHTSYTDLGGAPEVPHSTTTTTTTTVWHWCNYCDGVSPAIKEHLIHCMLAHNDLPPQPSRERIKSLQEKGIHVDFKGNEWESE